jgi:hypothetical protein
MAQELPGGSGYFPGFPVLNIGFSLTWIVCLTVLSDFLWVNWVSEQHYTIHSIADPYQTGPYHTPYVVAQNWAGPYVPYGCTYSCNSMSYILPP